ncbi:MAG: hypothetical protein ABIN36_15360 [Ferruginibacter sp.]
MKKILLLIFLSSNLKAVVYAQPANDTPHIEIKYVDPNLTSKTDISCEKFETSFDKADYKNYTVVDSFLLSKLKEAYENISYYKEPADIDVRYKLSINFTGKEKMPLVVCVDKAGEAMINGQSVRSEKFFRLLKKTIALVPREFSIK